MFSDGTETVAQFDVLPYVRDNKRFIVLGVINEDGEKYFKESAFSWIGEKIKIKWRD